MPRLFRTRHSRVSRGGSQSEDALLHASAAETQTVNKAEDVPEDGLGMHEILFITVEMAS
eukprot:6174720-Pleurochrysis_carterae.AAC.1